MATARIRIWFQDDARSPEMGELVRLLSDHYSRDFIGVVAVQSRTEDRIGGVNVKVHRLDEFDYKPGNPRIRIEAEFPTSVSGGPEPLLVAHATFVKTWAEQRVGLNRRHLLKNGRGEVRIPIDTRFVHVHESMVEPEFA